ncbi:cupredoxin domain-containing protein [Alteromonadaceae bacterium BrNp21-10]|nr:cupredoxin domain-containing protein [Alteromonadaceae bacterium BrNp21-10]
MHKYLQGSLLLGLLSLVTTQCYALPELVLEIRDHLFFPSQLNVPADKKLRLTIINHDNTPEEFDSFDLNREKVIFANSQTRIFIGPLNPGEYAFFGEFNPSTARGKIIVVNHTDDQNAN